MTEYLEIVLTSFYVCSLAVLVLLINKDMKELEKVEDGDDE